MAYFSTATAPERRNVTGKNRVWDFFPLSNETHPAKRRQPAQPRRKIRPTPTKSASGIPYWPSRDPIGEEGGMNLYGFCYNSPFGWYDFLGRDPKQLQHALSGLPAYDPLIAGSIPMNYILDRLDREKKNAERAEALKERCDDIMPRNCAAELASLASAKARLEEMKNTLKQAEEVLDSYDYMATNFEHAAAIGYYTNLYGAFKSGSVLSAIPGMFGTGVAVVKWHQFTEAQLSKAFEVGQIKSDIGNLEHLISDLQVEVNECYKNGYIQK